jgi:hypothetical protein
MVGWGFCAAGLITLLAGAWLLRSRIEKARSWQTAEAEVLSSRAYVKPGTDSDDSFTEYEVRYTVNGTPYTTKFEKWSSSLEEAQAKAARHSKGSQGRVSYNPADPRQIDANLGMNPATLSTPVSILGGGVVAILFGLAFVVAGAPTGPPGDLW